MANVSSSEHALPTLSERTRYYWKIVAKNSCGDSPGQVWSFTTEAEPCTLPGTPERPSPADGASVVGLDADLNWVSSTDATT